MEELLDSQIVHVNKTWNLFLANSLSVTLSLLTLYGIAAL